MALLGLLGPGGLLNSQQPQGLLGGVLQPNMPLLMAGLGMMGQGYRGALPGLMAGLQYQRQGQDRETNRLAWQGLLGGGGLSGGSEAPQAGVPAPAVPAPMASPGGPSPASPGGGAAAAGGRASGDAQRTAYTAAIRAGFTPFQAALWAGNAQQESNFNPQAFNEAEGAHGYIQWRGSRWQQLQEFARRRGTSPFDPETQARFSYWEMTEGPERTSGQAFLAARTPEEANRALKRYIRYGDESEGTRLANARRILGMPGEVPAVGGGAPGGAPAAAGAPAVTAQGFLANLSPQQRQVLGTLAQNNPAVAGALISRMLAAPQPQFDFASVGGQLYRTNSRSGQAEPIGPAPAQPTTDDLREYTFARQQGYEGSFLDFTQAKRAQGSARGLSFQKQGADIVGLDPATGREMSRIEGQTPPPQATDDIREYQLAKEQGFKGSFMDYMKQRGGGQGALPAEAQLYEFDMQQRAARGEKRIPFSEWSKDRRAGRDRSFDQETKLRGEFTQQTKTFGIVHDAFGRIASIVQERAQNPEAVSPASDIALVFAYMKMLDPESVVREGEFATAQNAGGVPERIQNLYNKALGGEFLTNEQRQDMIDTASRIYGQTRQTAEAIRDRYQDLAERYQVDPNRVVTLPATIEPARVGQRRGMKTAPAEPPVKSPRVRPQQVPPSLDTKTLPRVRTQTEFNALPKGSLYVEIDPEGKEILFRKP